MRQLTTMVLITMISLLGARSALAWGRRGHSTIAQTAAYVTAGTSPKLHWLISHSYDLGYYSNVPDIIWKGHKTYKTEFPQHFMDLEFFDRVFKAKNEQQANKMFIPDRLKFEKQYPNIPVKEGRAFWRIQELSDRLAMLTKQLKDSHLSRRKHRKLQGKWLVTAGTLGHYVGDMSMPLHCTEDHDGELTHQEGVHSFFEETVVDDLFPSLEEPIMAEAKASWPKFNATHRKMTPFQLAIQLCRNSEHVSKKLLAMDRKLGRTNMRKVDNGYRQFVISRLKLGALYLAEIWHRNINFPFDNRRFWYFAGKPKYIWPVGTKPEAEKK